MLSPQEKIDKYFLSEKEWLIDCPLYAKHCFGHLLSYLNTNVQIFQSLVCPFGTSKNRLQGVISCIRHLLRDTLAKRVEAHAESPQTAKQVWYLGMERGKEEGLVENFRLKCSSETLSVWSVAYCSFKKSHIRQKSPASRITSVLSYWLGAALEKHDLNESSTANSKRQELDTSSQMCSLQRFFWRTICAVFYYGH